VSLEDPWGGSVPSSEGSPDRWPGGSDRSPGGELDQSPEELDESADDSHGPAAESDGAPNRADRPAASTDRPVDGALNRSLDEEPVTAHEESPGEDRTPSTGQPAEQHDEPAPIELEEQVRRQLAELDGIENRPLAEHAERYDQVHRQLQAALSEIDGAAGT
jgi:hypothetical protein